METINILRNLYTREHKIPKRLEKHLWSYHKITVGCVPVEKIDWLYFSPQKTVSECPVCQNVVEIRNRISLCSQEIKSTEKVLLEIGISANVMFGIDQEKRMTRCKLLTYDLLALCALGEYWI
ncbi:hypothetical protein HOD08_01540 [bacterium]|nr:hypothetical protein [bacterium]